MEKEHLPQERKNIADDLQFMRSAIEKTSRQVKTEAHVMIMWGLVCIISYPAIHFLIKFQLFKWVWAVYLPMTIGLCYTFITILLGVKREKKDGFIPLLPKQLAWVWIIIMVLHGLTWSTLGTAFNNFCVGDPGFLWAILFSIALSVSGIFLSKEWLFGGIGIFIGMLLAFFIKDYAYLILGFATGLGCIIPAIIVQRNYNKQEKENA